MAAIHWNNISFAVRQGFWMKSRQIVHNMDMTLPSGTVLGLVGPNGAGKTTTIKLGAGLLEPESGRVLIQGIDAKKSKARACLGLLTETQYIYPHLRLKEWLVMLAGFSGLKGDLIFKRLGNVLELLELTNQEKQIMHTLSKGQLQRAGLAQALIHDPDILLLDEPMSGLDPYWRYRVQQILHDLKVSGKTILFSSHILHDVERLSDQVALIEDGKIQWKGCLSDLNRKIKGYEALCRTDRPEIFEKLVTAENRVQLPEGLWRVSLSADQKQDLLKLASDGQLTLESLRPIQEEIEEILFDFRGKSQQTGDI